MAAHDLKITRPWFERVVAGEKRAEIRKHDRDFQVGDRLVLTVDPPRRSSNGDPLIDAVTVNITHVLPASLFDGITPGYCVLSISIPGGAS